MSLALPVARLIVTSTELSLSPQGEAAQKQSLFLM